MRAAAVLIIATGLNDVIAGALPRFEPLYLYLAAIALVVWLDGIILGTITALGAIAFYALLFMPRADALSIAVLTPLLAALGVVIAVGLLRGLVRARRRAAPAVVVPRVHVQSLLAPPPVAMDNSEVLLAIDALRRELRDREAFLESAAAEARETLLHRVHLAEEENARLIRVVDGERAERMHLETAAREYETSTRHEATALRAAAEELRRAVDAERDRASTFEHEVADAHAARERQVQTLADLARRHEETDRAQRERIATLEATLADLARGNDETERALRDRITILEASLTTASATEADKAAALEQAHVETRGLMTRIHALVTQAANAEQARAETAQTLSDERSLRELLEVDASTRDTEAEILRGRIGELEQALAEVAGAQGDTERAYVDRIASLETASAEAVRLNAHAAIVEEQLQHANADAASLRMRIGEAEEVATVASAEARGLLLRVHELEDELRQSDIAFDAKLNTIVAHLAGDHEADLGKALEDKEEARAEVRSLTLRLSTLQKKFDEERQVVTAAAQREIDRLRTRLSELEKARVHPLPHGVVRPRVLIAHPDADLRMSARASLERAGYEILSAGDGLEALRTANAERPDVVIADAVMPKMDGRELCQLLKSQEKTAHIRVILLTRATDEVSKGDLPPDGILRKPVPLEMLKSTLAALLKPA
ncbi:MAG TPA: response regulator [Thermoanaerobaculia bacterium]|nr:response regulator [Thermoanaerobaculia bacterium]